MQFLLDIVILWVGIAFLRLPFLNRSLLLIQLCACVCVCVRVCLRHFFEKFRAVYLTQFLTDFSQILDSKSYDQEKQTL